MRYINKETLEILENAGEVRKAVAPRKLPKILTKAVLDNIGYDYLYDTAIPKVTMFQRLVEDGVKLIDNKYQVNYKIEEAFKTKAQKQEVLDNVLEQTKHSQIQILKSQIDKIVEDYINENSLSEQLSWSKQEQEARDYLNDNTSNTPYIDNLFKARCKNETKEELVQKILLKAELYSNFHSTLLGNYHSKLDEIASFTTKIETADEDLTILKSITLDNLQKD